MTRSDDDASSDVAPVHRTSGSRIGRFVVRGELGRGGMGVVYRAFDDARAAASLEHPHVVAIYDVGEHEGAPFIAMEFVVGQTLRERMRDASTLEEKIGWLSEVAEALGAAHDKGIVHRDVKPENLMIKRDGHVKVLDFGIARQAATPIDPSAPTATSDGQLGTITEEGVRVGTPRYMAPEQLKGDKLDGRCDQFAWGVVAYELFAGRPPWEASDGVSLIAKILGKEAPPLADAAPEVPSAIAAVVERALSKSPDARFDSMRELVGAMDAGRSREHPESAPRSREPGRRSRWFTFGLALAVLLGAAAVAASRAWRSSAAATTPASDGPAATREIVPTAAPLSTVPAAAAAFTEALQRARDGVLYEPAHGLTEAVRLDPTFAAAHVRMVIDNIDGEATHFERATIYRSKLDEHDRALLEAVAPWVHGDLKNCRAGLVKLQARYPDDVDLALMIARLDFYASDFEAVARDTDALLGRDAKLGGAWALRALADDMQQHWDAAMTSADRCLAASPIAISCRQVKVDVDRERGDCAAMARDARVWLEVTSDHVDAAWALAQAEFAQGAPLATVSTLLDQADDGMPDGENKEINRADHRIWLAELRGDFEAAFAGLAAARAAVTSASRSRHDHVALLELDLDLESGRDAEAKRVLNQYLASRGGFSLSPWELFDAGNASLLSRQEALGLVTEAEAETAREAMATDAVKLPGLDRGGAWRTIFGRPKTEREAKRAIAELPAFGRLTWETNDGDAWTGKALLLAGETDRALAVLQAAIRQCSGIYDPFEYVRRSLFLGQAREAKHDESGACEAYAFVLKRWGNAKPKSVMADEAKKRSKALGCPR